MRITLETIYREERESVSMIVATLFRHKRLLDKRNRRSRDSDKVQTAGLV